MQSHRFCQPRQVTKVAEENGVDVTQQIAELEARAREVRAPMCCFFLVLLLLSLLLLCACIAVFDWLCAVCVVWGGVRKAENANRVWKDNTSCARAQTQQQHTHSKRRITPPSPTTTPQT
jgi:hypothetical protein